MTGRHALTLATDDFHRRTLADVEDARHGRHTAEQPAIRMPERAPVIPRPELPEVPAQLHPETWATPPGTFDTEVLHTVRLGEIHAEPESWGGRGVQM